jgi:hypothetical protein
MKKGKMGGACGAYGGQQKHTQGFGGGRGKRLLARLDVGGRIIGK